MKGAPPCKPISMRLTSKSMPCESQLITNCDEFMEASGTNLGAVCNLDCADK